MIEQISVSDLKALTDSGQPRMIDVREQWSSTAAMCRAVWIPMSWSLAQGGVRRRLERLRIVPHRQPLRTSRDVAGPTGHQQHQRPRRY